MGKDKKRKKNHGKNKKHWTDMALFALTTYSAVFGTMGFVKSCNTEKVLAETNYKLAAVDHRPRVRFFSPKLVGLNLHTTANPKATLKSDTVDLSSSLQVRVRFRYTNIGNSNAKILGYVLTDTITDEKVIKDYIKNIDLGRKPLGDSIFSKYSYHELAESDSSEVTISHAMRYIANDRFVIHFIIYYENELGQRYDTYYWLRGKLNAFDFGQTVDQKTQKPIFVIDERQFWNIVEFTDENNYSSVYTADEKERNIHDLKKFEN